MLPFHILIHLNILTNTHTYNKNKKAQNSMFAFSISQVGLVSCNIYIFGWVLCHDLKSVKCVYRVMHLTVNHIFFEQSLSYLPSILLSRLIPYADEIIGDYQCGFRCNRSMTDQNF
jgi:hypothetical protein